MVRGVKKIFYLFSLLAIISLLSACGTAKAPVKAAAAPAGLTAAVAAQHNQADDCWLIVDNNIYNVTDYIAQGLSGGQAVVPYCGRDATTVFDSEGKNSSPADFTMDRQILEQYYIGSLSR
jgi:cytochrome b involved in lipid metabolism